MPHKRNIGLFFGSFKPFHKGHNEALKIASNENDEVFLFVSQVDRKRKGEFEVSWQAMNLVWEKYIKKILPDNVKITYVDEPLSATYKLLEKAEHMNNPNISFTIYGDEKDLTARFTSDKFARLFPNLMKNKQIKLKQTPRIASSTKMRYYLQLGLLDEFTNLLPDELKNVAPQIFQILGGKEA